MTTRRSSPRAEALLFAADRAHHVATVIRPALDRGDVVLTDRYVDSSMAYQGAGRELTFDEVRRLSRWATCGLTPDLTVLLDIPAAVGLERARGRTASTDGRRYADKLERESLEFHERVRTAFRGLAEAAPGRYLVLDATRPASELAADILTTVDELLAAAGRGRSIRDGASYRAERAARCRISPAHESGTEQSNPEAAHRQERGSQRDGLGRPRRPRRGGRRPAERPPLPHERSPRRATCRPAR